MNARNLLVGISWLALGWLTTAQAAIITTELNHISGNTWEYSYSVENDTAVAIDWFALYFPDDTYANLVNMSTLIDWDYLLVQPGDFFPGEDGFFDALALGQGIQPGETLSGFVVRFDFIGSGQFGGQMFEVYDSTASDPFASPDTGLTPSVSVPGPATLWVMLLGLLGLVVARRATEQNRAAALQFA